MRINKTASIAIVLLLFILTGCNTKSSPPSVSAEDLVQPSASFAAELPQINPASQVIVFNDPVIEEETRKLLFKPEGDITSDDVSKITIFNIYQQPSWTPGYEYRKIYTLEDLKWFTNLKKLTLDDFGITSLTGIENLKNLLVLSVRENKITSLEPVKALKNLVDLDCANNKVTDFTALSDLINLEELGIGNNSAFQTDTSFLKRLTKLKVLYAPMCGISDISVLGNMPDLEYLQFFHNNISDISSLKNLNKLRYLELGINNISDIGALDNLTQLEHINLQDNPIPEEMLKKFYEPKESDYVTVTINAKINDSLPEFAFELYARFNKRFCGCEIQTLTVINSSNGKTIQSISIPEFAMFGQTDISVYSKETMGFELEDLNFDGFEDIRLYDTTNGNYKTEWIYFVWNQKELVFETDHRFNLITYAAFDQEKQLIYGSDRETASDHIYYTYKYFGDEIVLIERATDNTVYFKSDVTDKQLAEIVPLLNDKPTAMFQHFVVWKLNMETMSMEITEDKYQLYIPNAWILLEEYDTGSEVGMILKSLSE